MQETEKKGCTAEIIEDIALLIDVFFTFIAVFLGKMGMTDLSNISFGISGFGLMIMLLSMIIKRMQRR
ncbi:MAG: hypothetical protein J6P21_04610 [Clostridia bacterium]|nr:hypothetical protein [Clostridia bacterium]